MKWGIRKQLRLVFLLWAIIIFALHGCQSPPSVVPLLTAAGKAIKQEREFLADDSKRQADWFVLQRETIEAGFNADLQQRQTLDWQWVQQHTRVYVMAIQAIFEHEMNMSQALKTRQQNLHMAEVAQQRAVGLIQRQDDLLGRIPDLRHWIEQSSNTNISEVKDD